MAAMKEMPQKVPQKAPEPLGRVADFLFEVGMLKEVPRTGFQYLGSGAESVAEHSLRVCFVAWVLARIEPAADAQRLVELALFHDLPEARTGDLNSVSKIYVKSAEARAWQDQAEGLPFKGEIESVAAELRGRETLESRLAHDADQIDMLLSLREQQEAGNPRAAEWIASVRERVQTEPGRRLVEAIMSARADRWWLDRLLGPGRRGS
jgi:putative hydrolase of HD superfamily